MVLVSVSIHEARVSSTFFGGLKASRRWKLKKIIILENIKSNELSLVFSKTVSKGLCCDKVWEISIFPSCTPICGIYRKSLLKRSCPSDYIRHIHHAFIIIFETRHTGLIMALLNVLVKLLPSLPFRLSPCFFIGVHRFLSTSCFYFHLLNFLGYARGTYLILQPRFYRLPRVRHSIRSHTFSGSVFSVLFPFCLQYFLSCILCFGCICF